MLEWSHCPALVIAARWLLDLGLRSSLEEGPPP
jgi:hypothetical protein